MKKNSLILGFIIATLAVTAIAETNNNKESESKPAKSVAWYTANVKEARAKNKECYDNKELTTTGDCKNSLHALQLVYVGVGN